MSDREWRNYLQLPWTRLKLIDGTLSERGAYLMRRRGPDCRWQYRLMSAQEMAEYCDLHAV